MSLIDRLLDAVTAELERVAPIHEGLRDYSRLNLQPATRRAVDHALELYNQRVWALKTMQRVLEWLASADLHALALVHMIDNVRDVVERCLAPIDLPDVTPEVYNDLTDNLDTITRAYAQFDVIPSTDEAVRLTMEWGEPSEQPPTPQE